MIKKQYILWLIICTICVVVLETSIAGEHVVESPEHEKLTKEIDKRGKDIETQKKKIEEIEAEKGRDKTERDTEVVKEAKKLKDMLDAQIKDVDLFDKKFPDEKQLDKKSEAVQEKAAVEKEIVKIEQELARTGTSTGKDTTPKKGIPDNAIDTALKLAEKTPADQIKALKRELTQTVFEKTYATPEKRVKALDDLFQIIDVYDITDSGVLALFNDRYVSPSVTGERMRKAKTWAEREKIITEVIDLLSVDSLRKQDYNNELKVLKSLATVVEAVNPSESKEIVARMKERIKEITDFNPGKKPTQETALGKQLKLSSRIPSDAIAVLRIELGNAMADYRESVKTNKNQASEKIDKTLQNIKTTMENYALTDGAYKDFYEEIKQTIETMNPNPRQEVPQGVVPEDVKEGGFIDSFAKGETPKNIAQAVHATQDTLQLEVDYVVAQEIKPAETFAKAGSIDEGLSTSLETVPELVIEGMDLLKTVNKDQRAQGFNADGTVQTVVNLVVSNKSVEQVRRDLTSVKNIEEQTRQKVDAGVSALGHDVQQPRKIVVEFANFGVEADGAFKKEVAAFDANPHKQVSEKKAALKEIDKALAQLKQEREAQSVPVLISPEIESGIKRFFLDLVERVKNLFNRPKGIKERLNTAATRYEDARTVYMEFLGAPRSASIEEINALIIKNPNVAQQKKLETALFNAAKEYMAIVKDYAGIVQGIGTTVDFISRAPDSMLVDADFNDNLLEEKAKLAKNITTFFDIRKAQQEYLSQIQKASSRALEEISNMTQSSHLEAVNIGMSKKVAQITEGVRLYDLGNFMKQNTYLETALEKQRAEIEKKLPRASGTSGNSAPDIGDGGGYD